MAKLVRYHETLVNVSSSVKKYKGRVSYTRDDGVEEDPSSPSPPAPILSLDFRTSSARVEGGNETVHVPARGAVKHARNHVFPRRFAR